VSVLKFDRCIYHISRKSIALFRSEKVKPNTRFSAHFSRFQVLTTAADEILFWLVEFVIFEILGQLLILFLLFVDSIEFRVTV
jgi:hypothetical protein